MSGSWIQVQIIGYGCPLYADLENRIVPELPVMTVTPGMTNLATSISWTASAHAQKYLLVIWDADGNEVVREETTGRPVSETAAGRGLYGTAYRRKQRNDCHNGKAGVYRDGES